MFPHGSGTTEDLLRLCNGRGDLRSLLFFSVFQLRLNKFQRVVFKDSSLCLQVKKGTLNTDVLKGQVIKLKIRCSFLQLRYNYVSLFKYEGHLNCKFTFSSVIFLILVSFH